MIKRKERMKEGSNNSDKMACPRSGDAQTLPIYTHYQQLPIKVKLSRLQVQPLIEKGNHDHELHVPGIIFQSNRLAHLRQLCMYDSRGLVSPCFETAFYG
jgi:hypothetical protein